MAILNPLPVLIEFQAQFNLLYINAKRVYYSRRCSFLHFNPIWSTQRKKQIGDKIREKLYNEFKSYSSL